MKSAKKNKKGNYKTFLKWFWGSVVLVFTLFVLLIIGIIAGVFKKLPDARQLENPETTLATEIYSSDGVLLGKFFNENRSKVAYDEISPNVYNALIATEDVRFEDHSGIDPRGTLAIPYYIIRGKKKGASTISQQLAKNLFGRNQFNTLPKKIIQKLKEWIIAIRLERYYTKQEIINMYLNKVDFGSNSWGIKAASKTYFNKLPDALNVQESATIIGVLKAVTAYNPYLNPERSLNRRNVVLGQMYKYGYIKTQEEFDSLVALPIKLDYKVESHNQGMARYFREFLRMELNEWSKSENIDLYASGLKIHTTIDSRMQTYAEAATREHLTELQELFFKHWDGRKNAPFSKISEKQIESIMTRAVKNSDRYRALKRGGKSWEEIQEDFQIKRKMKLFSYKGDIEKEMSPYDSVYYYKYFLHPGFMAMDTKSGQIKAWVGGIDYKYFKYDHVNKRAKRQVGSTFKPFVYTVGIMEGYSPCLKVPNVPVIFPDFNNWRPRNSDGEYGEIMTLNEGMSKSVNCMTAWVMKQVGPEAVLDLVAKMGIDTSDMDPYPSICLGTPDVSVFEMVGAFNTYGNNGVWVEPTFISRIEDKNGNTIKEYVAREVPVLKNTHNFVMLDMLQSVTRGWGTATRLRYRYNFTNQIGGKTGTTQNNSDGWFIGTTPEITAGCWVGAEDRSVHFRRTDYGQGASMALPIWAYFMKKVYADSTLGYKQSDFEIPEEKLPVELDCSNYEADVEPNALQE
ncbi:MAG: penicillin-binding protein [Bacteroidetes bacterium]|nr:penicillin-binding protein [Bacteroidota bacterium]MBT3799592.1 penicillin-binding protein [Bacteroidota bacterium]MBT4339936.1 penicillin-binding protein [Bacteroidota bacterium]MBT5992263.1 penicillin-binding protein [Bacteroidota bacterium]MBT7038457.1 penicillin-binding protein [Bacteroidota bacterium]